MRKRVDNEGMRVITPEYIFAAFDECKKYVLPNGEIDPNAPDEAKKAYEIWKEWEKKHENIM